MPTKHDVSPFDLVVLHHPRHYRQCSSCTIHGQHPGRREGPSGAGVAKAKIKLVNVATGATTVATSDESGNYRFVSLAPGSYKITVEAADLRRSEADVTLLTAQNLNVPDHFQGWFNVASR